LFGSIQAPLNKERERAKFYEGKTYRDIEISDKFGGNVEQGQEAFNRIAGAVSSSRDDSFHFYPQREQQQSTNLADDENSDIIRNVRQNRNN